MVFPELQKIISAGSSLKKRNPVSGFFVSAKIRKGYSFFVPVSSKRWLTPIRALIQRSSFEDSKRRRIIVNGIAKKRPTSPSSHPQKMTEKITSSRP